MKTLDQTPGTKKTHIEFLRIAACFLVIVNHTNSMIFTNLSPCRTWLCSLTYFFICKIAVPVFLLIMGALLLEKEDVPRKSVERFFRILVMTFAFSALYYLYYGRRNVRALSLKEFLTRLPNTPASTALWYLYLYMGLLLMLPILQRLVKALSRRHLEYLLLLSVGLYGAIPLAAIFIPYLRVYPMFTAGLIGPYIGQVLLGYYIERYVSISKRGFWLCLCGFVLSIAFQTAGTFLLYTTNPDSYLALDDRTMITITGSAACFYICVKYLFSKYQPRPALEQAIRRLGALTFGAYLLADGVIAQSRPLYPALCGHMNPMLAMVLWELFIFAVSALITAVLRLIPPLRKWL